MSDALDRALKDIARGIPPATAARRARVSLETLWYAAPEKMVEALASRAEKTRRADVTIRREAARVLAEAGWTDAKIAAAFGVSRQRAWKLRQR